jgi:hypothetical protein
VTSSRHSSCWKGGVGHRLGRTFLAEVVDLAGQSDRPSRGDGTTGERESPSTTSKPDSRHRTGQSLRRETSLTLVTKNKDQHEVLYSRRGEKLSAFAKNIQS